MVAGVRPEPLSSGALGMNTQLMFPEGERNPGRLVADPAALAAARANVPKTSSVVVSQRFTRPDYLRLGALGERPLGLRAPRRAATCRPTRRAPRALPSCGRRRARHGR